MKWDSLKKGDVIFHASVGFVDVIKKGRGICREYGESTHFMGHTYELMPDGVYYVKGSNDYKE